MHSLSTLGFLADADSKATSIILQMYKVSSRQIQNSEQENLHSEFKSYIFLFK